MEGKKYVLKTGFLIVLLVVCHVAESKWVPVPVPVISGPLCTSQFTLVNHACAFLPFAPTPHHRSRPAQPQASGGNDHHRRHHNQQEGGHGGHGHGVHGGHGGHGGHGDHGGHGGNGGHGHGDHGGHGHGNQGGRGRRSREGRNRRQRRRRHHDSAVQEDCCRWLKEVDDECVCDLLVHLPPFLSRPLHKYTVRVDGTCSVTFQCGSRIKI